MKIKDVMRPPTVRLPVNSSIHDVLVKLVQHQAHMIPIIDAAERVVGMVTLDDMVDVFMPTYYELLRDFAALQDKGQIGSLFDSGLTGLDDQQQAREARDVMQIDIRWIHEDDHLLEAASKLQIQGLTRLPVVDKDQKLVGTIADSELVLALLSGNGRLASTT